MKKVILFLLISLFFLSCDSNKRFSGHIPIKSKPEISWEKDEYGTWCPVGKIVIVLSTSDTPTVAKYETEHYWQGSVAVKYRGTDPDSKEKIIYVAGYYDRDNTPIIDNAALSPIK